VSKNKHITESKKSKGGFSVARVLVPIFIALMVILVIMLLVTHRSSPVIQQPIMHFTPRPKVVHLQTLVHHKVSKMKHGKAIEVSPYLTSINSMSLNLNLLTLENQVLKQKISLADSILALKKSGVTNIGDLAGMGNGTSIISDKKDLKISVIYQSGKTLTAVLRINGNDIPVDKGQMIAAGEYTVMAITPNTVTLRDNTHHDDIVLSIAEDMESL
jgi:type IV pilus biogenesis protein PilP